MEQKAAYLGMSSSGPRRTENDEDGKE